MLSRCQSRITNAPTWQTTQDTGGQRGALLRRLPSRRALVILNCQQQNISEEWSSAAAGGRTGRDLFFYSVNRGVGCGVLMVCFLYACIVFAITTNVQNGQRDQFAAHTSQPKLRLLIAPKGSTLDRTGQTTRTRTGDSN